MIRILDRLQLFHYFFRCGSHWLVKRYWVANEKPAGQSPAGFSFGQDDYRRIDASRLIGCLSRAMLYLITRLDPLAAMSPHVFAQLVPISPAAYADAVQQRQAGDLSVNPLS